METTKQQIIKRLSEKSINKYKVYDNTLVCFEEIKNMISNISQDIKSSVSNLEIDIPVEYRERGKFEIEMKVAGDMILMTMHSNIFKLPKAHYTMQGKYIKEDPMRSYCGIINIYNFLADSFKYNRENDLGYLIARVFINKDRHFFVEGRDRLDIDYWDFMHEILDKQKIEEILLKCIEYAIDFDLYSPPYKNVETASVYQLKEVNDNMKMKTGKRLGFKFQNELDNII